MMKRSITLFVFLVILFALGTESARAATLAVVPASESVKIGNELNVDVVISSQDVNVNAAQALIAFPSDILQFVSADLGGSAFGFWVENPVVKNGMISFLGGASPSVSGKTLRIFTMKFRALKEGRGTFSISDGVVTADDGKGTNVLFDSRGASITVSTTGAPVLPPAVQEQPKKVERKAVPSAKLPIAPTLKVNLYPDSADWSNQIADAIVLWDLPDDVTQFAATVDQIPKATPTAFDKELFNGKNFGSLKEGIWYVHVRFRNNVGAGPVAHYRIAIDTTPPLPFEIGVVEGTKISGAIAELKTDNPQPVLHFETKDSLSGLSHYLVQVGDQEVMRVDGGEIKLPLQPPGTRTVLVKAVDKAGNERAQGLTMEILPIAPPVITFIKKDAFAGEGDLLIRGTAVPEFIVKVSVKKQTGDIVAESAVSADVSGNWETTFGQPLKRGSYIVEVTAQDARGALSLPVRSELFKIREKPLLTIAGFGITQFWLFVGFIVILLSGFGAGWFSYRLWREQLGRKVIIAERDVVTVFNLVKADMDKVLKSYADKRIDEREATEMEFLLNKIKGNVEKMQKYILENIKEISE